MAAPATTVAMRTKILTRAKSQIGVREIPAYSNVTPYTKWYGITGPWCAMFVSWVFYYAGFPLEISTKKGFAYCPYGVEWFRARGAWAGPETRPQPGWLVFFNFPGDEVNRVSHVGIVEGVGADGRIITIEGNTNAAGSRTGGNVMRHYRSRAGGIVGYGRIDYKAPATTPTEDDLMIKIEWFKGEPSAPGDQADVTAAYRVVYAKVKTGAWTAFQAFWVKNPTELKAYRGHGYEEVPASAARTPASVFPYIEFMDGPFKSA